MVGGNPGTAGSHLAATRKETPEKEVADTHIHAHTHPHTEQSEEEKSACDAIGAHSVYNVYLCMFLSHVHMCVNTHTLH